MTPSWRRELLRKAPSSKLRDAQQGVAAIAQSHVRNFRRREATRQTLLSKQVAELLLATALAAEGKRGSFADFDARAKAGAPLNVVFFGASLTWGANASDPIETSYRAVMRDRFEQACPAAHFRFRDAAIGGTGSQLGVFRLERDVLAHKPALVFVDFTANDGIYSDDRSRRDGGQDRRGTIGMKTPKSVFPRAFASSPLRGLISLALHPDDLFFEPNGRQERLE